jgi:hypothetical protein
MFRHWDDDLYVGLVIVRDGRMITVQEVTPNSLAAQWSLEVGDEVIRLKGVDPDGLTYTSLWHELMTRGRRGVLIVRRKGRMLELPFAVPELSAAERRGQIGEPTRK